MSQSHQSRSFQTETLPDDPDALLSRWELSQVLPVSYQTLSAWASQGKGPPYVKLGTRVAYRVEDVRRWIREQRVGGGDEGQ